MAGITGMSRNKRVMLTVRLDAELKKNAERHLNALGLTATDAVEKLYMFISEHGRMPLTSRVVTFDLTDPAIAFNPVQGIADEADRFLSSLKSEDVVCCDRDTFVHTVCEYFTKNLADKTGSLFAGVQNVTFMDAADHFSEDDLHSWFTRLRSVLQLDFNFSAEQSKTFITNIVSADQADTFINSVVDSQHVTVGVKPEPSAVSYKTPNDLVRALAERHVHCTDIIGMSQAQDNLPYGETPDVAHSLLPARMTALAEKFPLIYCDGKRPMDAQTVAELYRLLTQDFWFSDALAGVFINNIRTESENYTRENPSRR